MSSRVSSSSPQPLESQDGDELDRKLTGPSGRELVYLDDRVSVSTSGRPASIDAEDTPEGITDVEASSVGPVMTWVSDQRDLVTLSYAVLIGGSKEVHGHAGC